ncbi:MAG: tetratricopeptide repeat protein, partial [Fusobacteriaceae bacterium]
IEEQMKEDYKMEIEKVNNNVLKSEFNREKMEIMYEITKEEKEKKIQRIQERIQGDYKFFDAKIKKETYLFIGREFKKMKKEFEAIEAYEKALTYEENSDLDFIIHNELGILKDEKKLSLEAVEHYKKSLKIKESEASYGNLILLYLDLSNFEEATKYIEKAIMRFPNSSSLNSQKGLLYKKTGDCYRAIESYTRAINLDNKNKIAWFNRSITYSEIGENFKALNDLFQIIKINKECDKVFNMIAHIYFLEKKTDKALEYYDKSLKVNKDSKEAFYGKIDIYLSLGKNDEVRTLLDDFVLKNENEDKVYCIYSQIIREINIKEALKYIKRAIILSPSNYEYYCIKGHIEIAMNRREDALKSFKTSLNINTDNHILHHDLGLLNFELKNYEEALIYYKKAIKLNDIEAEYYNSKGLCLEVIGDEEENKIAKKVFYIEALKDYEKSKDLFEKIMFVRNINIIKGKLKKL